MIIVFENEQLLPAEWRRANAGAALRIFNPGLLRDGSGWLLAYRVVTEPGLSRRMAICRLDASYGVIDGSQTPVSDFIQFRAPGSLPAQATHWFADPRLYRFGNRLFVYWNSGWHEPRNCQFLQQLDPRTLRPVGYAHELQFGGRQKLEKNWGLFCINSEANDHSAAGAPIAPAGATDLNPQGSELGFYAVYSVSPHRVLRFADPAADPVQFTEAFADVPNPGGFARVHGGLRGGAPPVQLADRFYSFCHSIENSATGYQYVAAVYRFAARPPFAPTDMPTRPLPLIIPSGARRTLPKLNPAISDILYPAGAAYAGGQWILSLGIDDEHCALAVLDQADVVATLAPVSMPT